MMITELEQEFYDTFGIKPEHNDGCKLADNYWNNENLQKQYKNFDEYLNTNCTESDSGLCYSTCDFAYDDLKYPDITAEKLLEMICIYNNNVYENEKITPSNINTLKEDVLHWFITDFVGNDKIKHQIQQLFNENSK